ncbi:hypothetical protein ABE426_16010 [Sphingobacterium faecium]|uniref:hypothetical protein n=1 Tax=Sphingobacterium faecium TaxID=34087 RepID=UPI00320AFEEA
MSNNSNILKQVRESYRFLFEYQTRMLNLMSYIEKRFALTYSGGHSKFSNPAPKNGKGSLDFWAWDWLNMYYYEFHFGFYNNQLTTISPTQFSKDDDYYGFSVFLLSDDGYFQNHLDATTNVDRIKIDSFRSVEESKTKLIFVASKNIWDSAWWHMPERNNLPQSDFITKEFEVNDNYGENQVMVFKSFDLEHFFQEQSALHCLKEFERLCDLHSICFKVVDNQFETK